MLGLYLPLYMFYCMRASASGLMALLVLWFFPLNIFIHVTVRCDAEHVALLPGGQYTGHVGLQRRTINRGLITALHRRRFPPFTPRREPRPIRSVNIG